MRTPSSLTRAGASDDSGPRPPCADPGSWRTGGGGHPGRNRDRQGIEDRRWTAGPDWRWAPEAARHFRCCRDDRPPDGRGRVRAPADGVLRWVRLQRHLAGQPVPEHRGDEGALLAPRPRAHDEASESWWVLSPAPSRLQNVGGDGRRRCQAGEISEVMPRTNWVSGTGSLQAGRLEPRARGGRDRRHALDVARRGQVGRLSVASRPRRLPDGHDCRTAPRPSDRVPPRSCPRGNCTPA
jgi:hypothetical protein